MGAWRKRKQGNRGNQGNQGNRGKQGDRACNDGESRVSSPSWMGESKSDWKCVKDRSLTQVEKSTTDGRKALP
eukprot:1323363-Amorphochlora_amoeboformis.AAC.1